MLLVTFLVTALLGLILAIQVNYKLKIPLLKKLLTWHVDFGIGMTMIAVFHFLWHWSYYTKLLKITKTAKLETASAISEDMPAIPVYAGHMSAGTFRVQAALLGFTSIITQIILLREFLLLFSGNELVIGIILANWMILTALGALIGRYSRAAMHKNNFLSYAFIILGLLPAVTVFIADFFKNTVFQPGIAFGAGKILFTAAVILLPFCLLSGYLFTYIASAFSAASGRRKIDRTYAWESIGSILAGLLFSYVLAGKLSTFQVLGLLFLINTIAFLLIAEVSTVTKAVLAVIFFFVSSIPYIMDLDKAIKQYLFINQNLTYIKDTPLGNLAITDYGGQLNFFENNVLLFTSENEIVNEEATHFAMIQHSNPQNVLLISGGISGITNEILKYKVKRLDYVELNPWIFKIGREFTTALKDPVINTITDDARLYIRNTDRKYDVVIINVPEPVTAQINRYYTIEFYRNVRRILNTGGIVTFGLPSSYNYMSDEAADLNSSIYKTISEVFTNVLIFTGEKNYYVASDAHLDYDIAGRFAKRGIENLYVNQYYLDNDLIKQRSGYMRSVMNPDAKINRDFSPVTYFKQIRLWLSQFSFNRFLTLPIIFLMLLLFTVFIIRAAPSAMGMFTVGFTASSVEIVLILAFQVIYGYIYLVMGIFFATFMAGLAAGAFAREKFIPKVRYRDMIIIQMIIGIIVLLTLPMLLLIKANADSQGLVYFICLSLLFIIALFVGTCFSVASSIQKNDNRIDQVIKFERNYRSTLEYEFIIAAAGTYSSDLIGSAAGALITSIILIPGFGLYITTSITGAWCFVTVFILHLKRK